MEATMSENALQRGLALGAALALCALVAMLFSSATPNPNDLQAGREFFEVRRLYFAVGVLAALFLLLLLALLAAVERNASAAAQGVFDAFIQVIPPIMTLVLGFYFGQSGPTPAPAAPPVTLTPTLAAIPEEVALPAASSAAPGSRRGPTGMRDADNRRVSARSSAAQAAQ